MSLIARATPRRPIPFLLKPFSAKSLVHRRDLTTRQLDEARAGRERVVILGSGWAGFVLSRNLDPKKFQVVVVAPRSYFVFTPLLASTAVGTLEFRTTLESVRHRDVGVEFFQGWADDVNFLKKTVTIEEAVTDQKIPAAVASGLSPSTASEVAKTGLIAKKKANFDLDYDKLVVAVGCYAQTFNTPGVREHAYFLKDVTDARKIRKQILKCFETAASPTTSDKVRKEVLTFAIVGGGPTGIEFAAELHDLVHEDLVRIYPNLIPLVQICVYDVAPQILSMFDKSLSEYATKKYARDGIQIMTSHHILALRLGSPDQKPEDVDSSTATYTVTTKQEGDVGIGMCVWSTGLMMNPFIAKALSKVRNFPDRSATLSDHPKCGSPPTELEWNVQRHPRTGALMVNDRFQTLLSTPSDPKLEATMHDVYALGDVSSFRSGALTATAQVANQEAKWLGKHLNEGDVEIRNFTFRNLGVMTYLGNKNAILQTGGELNKHVKSIRGRTAWAIWRGAYITNTISVRNKLLIGIYWTINWIMGRDTSRF